MFLPVILERQHGVVPKYGESALLVQYISKPHFLHHLVTSNREDRDANLCKQTDNKRIQHEIRVNLLITVYKLAGEVSVLNL